MEMSTKMPGLQSNLAYVFTASPKTADPAKGRVRLF